MFYHSIYILLCKVDRATFIFHFHYQWKLSLKEMSQLASHTCLIVPNPELESTTLASTSNIYQNLMLLPYNVVNTTLLYYFSFSLILECFTYRMLCTVLSFKAFYFLLYSSTNVHIH